jgi:D-psicose/D-tagatose/L-ribulose 3-epimerase
MKVGINMLLWTTHVGREHFPLFAKLKAVGYDGIEIPVMDVSDPAHFAMLGRVAREHGLECTASTAMPADQGSPISPDPAARRAAGDHLRRVIECAHNIGAELLIGPIYQVIGQFTGTGPTQTELDHAAGVHREIAAFAETAGVRCAVEPLNRFEAHLINTMEQASDYMRRLDHPARGAMHDTFHAHIEEKDPVASIETLHQTGKLLHVHISENDRGTPGRGHAQLRPTIARLKSLGYDRWLTVEAFGSALPALANATRIWRSTFPSEEQVYSEGYRLIRDSWEAG